MAASTTSQANTPAPTPTPLPPAPLDSSESSGPPRDAAGGVSPTWPVFARASPADIIRSSEKDDLFVAMLCESLAESLRGIGGAWSRVTSQGDILRLFGRLAYHGLTTGLGRQTLGEEYCSIIEVSGALQSPPTPARRALLVLLQAVAPYLLLRANAALVRQGTAIQLAGEADSLDHHPPLSERVPRGGSSEAASTRGDTGMSLEEEAGKSSTGRSPSAGEPQPWAAPLPPTQWRATGRRAARRLLVAWLEAQPALTELGVLVDRAHLMMFYFQGEYFHWAKRLAAIQHAFTARHHSPQPRYTVLGLLVLVQVGLLGLDWAGRTLVTPLASSLLRRSRAPQGKHAAGEGAKGQTEGGGARESEDEGWVSLEVLGASGEAGEGREEDAAWDGANATVSASRCTLCLEQRKCPTSTPCGHVFCWHCIAEWCNTKQECPLCRTPTVHSSLVALYHTDF